VGKRRALVAVLVLGVALTLAGFGILIFLNGLYPQVEITPEDSNLTIRGVVVSVEENHRSEGWSAYHVYRYYLRVNISEVFWVDGDLAD
jgi:hypothetical protein